MNQLDAYNLFHQGILAFNKIEMNGMRVDVEYYQNQTRIINKRIKHYKKQLELKKFIKRWKHKYGGRFNLNSDKQLSHMLFDVMKLEPPKQTTKGNDSTDEEALRELISDVPELEQLLKIRKLSKVKNTYIAQFLREEVNGFVHPFMNLHIARSYRPSVDSPNTSNIVKRDEESKRMVRRGLFPRKWHQILEIDFKGIEVCISACYHKDPKFIYDITQGDMHTDEAQEVFILKDFKDLINEKGFKNIPVFKRFRDATKNSFVFPQFYGDYYGNCAINICRWTDLPTKGKWKRGLGPELPNEIKLSDHFRSHGIRSFDGYSQYLKNVENVFWNERFKVYQEWKDTWFRKYQRRGYFDTLTGFRCSGLMNKKEVCNYPIQGSAFHCLLWTLIEVQKVADEEGWKSRIMNQIYDSLVFDCHPDETEHVAIVTHEIATKKLREHWPWIIVDLEVEADLCEIDEPWSEKKSYKIAA